MFSRLFKRPHKTVKVFVLNDDTGDYITDCVVGRDIPHADYKRLRCRDGHLYMITMKQNGEAVHHMTQKHHFLNLAALTDHKFGDSYEVEFQSRFDARKAK